MLIGNLFSLAIAAQISSPSTEAARRERLTEADLERRMKLMADLERSAIQRSQQTKEPVAREPVINKETKDRILIQRRIRVSDAAPYAELLKSESAGIIKIFPSMNCLSSTVIRVDAECASYVPMSSDFSFRNRGYIDHFYEDIGYTDGVFSNRAFFTQAAFVELGDVPLRVELSADPKVLALAKVADKDVTIDDAKLTAAQLKATMEIDAVPVSSQVVPELGKTYGLRVIAYRFSGSVPPVTAKSSLIELRFLSLNADKRDDLTLVFRILSKDENGGLTIVWQELRRAAAPKLKLGKGQPLSDFRLL